MSERFSGDAMAQLRHKFRATKGATVKERIASETEEEQKVDGRSMRRTGRTAQIAFRAKEETIDAIHAYAEQRGIRLAEVLERAMDALLAQDLQRKLEKNGKS